MKTTYGLPDGAWLFNDTEAQNLNADYAWGGLSPENQDAAGQDFSKIVSIDITKVEGPQWNSGYGIRNVSAISSGDRCLLVIWLRSADGPGKVTLSVQDAVTFSSELSFNLPLDDSWRRFLIPFESSDDYPAGDLQMVLQLNWQDQTIQIGGLAALNYGNAVDMEALPRELNNQFYPGHEADAPWRADAQQRIDQLRRADLEIQVLDEGGSPLENANVEVKMLEHEFGFGTAVAAHLFAGNSRQNDTYEQRLLDLDGKGHRFNSVVFENASKWRAWEENWFGLSPEDKGRTVEWLVDRGFDVRGHTLVWPSWNNLPGDLQSNQDNPEYIKERILEHIETIVNYPGFEDNISDWDVLNEISVLRDLEMAMQGAPGYPTGREIYVDIFNKLLEEDPDAVTVLNDYTTFGSGSSKDLAENLKQFTQELLDAGVKIDAIGFQGHIAPFPTGMTELYDILEDFHTTFGAKAKITEFDMKPEMDDSLAAKYLTDFYTMAFSHESVDAILMWGFWDGAHWFDNAPLFNEDWSLKPSGQAFFDLVFDEWWTEESGQTDAAGHFALRGFKGTYEVSVGCNGGALVDTLQLSEALTHQFNCANLTHTTALEQDLQLRLFPNPAAERLQLEWKDGKKGTIRLMDLTGREVIEPVQAYGRTTLELDLPAGHYEMVLEVDNGRVVKKVVITE